MILHGCSYTLSHSSPSSIWTPDSAVILSIIKSTGYTFHTSKSVATHLLVLILRLSELSDTYLLLRMQKAPAAAAATMTTTHATTIPAMQPAEQLELLFGSAKKKKKRLKIMQFDMNADIIGDVIVPQIC